MTIHPTAEISPNATVGAGCQIWHYTQIREAVAGVPVYRLLLSRSSFAE